MNSSPRDDDARGISIAAVAPRPEVAHLAIGMFDGVHVGHAAVIREMLAEKEHSHHHTAVLTFEPHPLTVVAPARAPARLMRPEKRAEMLRSGGVDQVITVTFDATTRDISPGDFVQELRRIFPRMETICIGENWTFGRGREGNVALLEREGKAHNFEVVKVPVVTLGDGIPVSSTRIREAIRTGDMALATRLLGRDYAISGKVVRGEQRGRQLGFPTANVAEIYELLPPNGVYACRTRIASKENGPGQASMVNIGRRPTFGADLPPTVESHLLDYAGDLYGREVEVTGFLPLREERRFNSIDELRAQLGQDAIAAREALR